jgi:hypothetical protein
MGRSMDENVRRKVGVGWVDPDAMFLLLAFLNLNLCTHSFAMTSEPPAMLFREGDRGAPAQFGTRSVTEPGREFWPSLVVEGHKRAIKSSVP